MAHAPAHLHHAHPKRFQLKNALLDVQRALAAWRIWLALAWSEFVMTYRRSVIGVAWITISFLIFVLVKITIFGSMLPTSDTTYYFVYLPVGYCIFSFLSSTITAAPRVFIGAESWIKNEHLPLTLFVFKAVTRMFFVFFLQIIVVALLLVYFSYEISPNLYLVLPAFLVITINAIWIKILLGTVGARFRDIEHVVSTVMRIMFFLSPVMWMPEQMGTLMTYLWWNPLFHYMEIFRSAIIDQTIPWTSWFFVGCVTIVGTFTSLIMFALFRHRIVFWL